jgi:hypothetical protein
MNAKNIITALLLVFVAGSIFMLFTREFKQTPATENESAVTDIEQPIDSPDQVADADMAASGAPLEAEPANIETPTLQADRLVVFYFHSTARCRSCLTIERYTGEAITQCFSGLIETGEMEWRPVNTDEPGNEHYRDDYSLYTKSVVVSDLQDNEEIRWKNLDQVWQLLGNEAEFKDYIREEVEAWLEDDP